MLTRLFAPGLASLLLLGAGCIGQSAARRARLAALVGQSELELVQTLGVPSRSYTVGDRTFLSYAQERFQVLPGFGGFGPWGGWSGGWNGVVPPEVVRYDCDTTFEVRAGTVAGFTERGNACG